jgi:uncharacterized protein (TIGR02391 family)
VGSDDGSTLSRVAQIPPLDQAVVRELADLIGATDDGLTNEEIDELLRTAGIRDPNPQPESPYFYRAINKRDRLYAALATRQQNDRAANAVLHFLECMMQPVRFRGRESAFAAWRDELNEALAFAGLVIDECGRVDKRSAVATTLDEAKARSRRLRRQLTERGVHPRILAACGTEIRDDNYFHTVLEASKSLTAEIRQLTGLTSDGVTLVDEAFEKGQRPFPLLACNKLQTETDWSEQGRGSVWESSHTKAVLKNTRDSPVSCPRSSRSLTVTGAKIRSARSPLRTQRPSFSQERNPAMYRGSMPRSWHW